MSTAPSETPTTVSLADEEAVKRILTDTLFGLWGEADMRTGIELLIYINVIDEDGADASNAKLPS